MGVVKNLMVKAGGKAADKIAKLSSLSPEQVQDIQNKRNSYLMQMPDLTDDTAQEMTEKLLAASSVEIYNAYLPQLKELYLPVKQVETCNRINNIRYINITKWVTDTKENSLDKLVNVYSVLSDEECNIALIFNRTCETTNVYLGVSNNTNQTNNVKVQDLEQRLENSLKGNFPGAEWNPNIGKGTIPNLDNENAYSVASVSNIPTEKSEKFISQTIEKVLDGVIPTERKKEYTIILLASPIQNVEERKLILSDFYTGLVPYSSWQTNFTFTQNDATSSMAIFGVNAGVSAGIQNARNEAVTNTVGSTDSSSTTNTDSSSTTNTDSSSTTNTDSNSVSDSNSSSNTNTSSSSSSLGTSTSNSKNLSYSQGKSENYTFGENVSATGNIVPKGLGVSATYGASTSTGVGNTSSYTKGIAKTVGETASETIGQSSASTIGKTVANTIGRSIADSSGKAVANSVGRSVAQTLGRAVSTALATTEGLTKSFNLGGNFGANFARSSNITISVGKNEGITQTFTNYSIKHALSVLDEQMKRYEKSTALGMWDFAAYVLSEDHNIANSVAHSYLALTQGEESHLSKTAVNIWRGDVAEEKGATTEISTYLKNLRHPVFALNPDILEISPDFNIYPPVVTATTGLTGKELSYSLNFPLHSVPGLPILKCAEFGRNIVSYDNAAEPRSIRIGNIFHMNHMEPVSVNLSLNSLASHVFITGSTGSGKSNTIYKILSEARNNNVKFLVVEPAKGEYKDVFGNDEVSVYGTNPSLSALLKLNPFSFPSSIHILEHIDRLIEIFNVCWPMYAAMPAVLKDAVERSYEDCGWDLLSSKNAYKNDLYPSFKDVAFNVKRIIDSSEYDAENKGAYKGSLLTRLKSLTNGINGLIFCEEDIDNEKLFDANVIVDISRVGSSETKSLIMGMLVLKLQEYRMDSKNGINSELRHITVLEEAHNLLKRTSTDQPVEGGNLLGKSVEMLANAIAEMRTYGEGFIIADQAPGLLDMSVIRNTNTKIIMRLPDILDRELVGKSANLNNDQILELAKLPCGVGAIYQNEWVQPVLCKVDRYEHADNIYSYNPELNPNERLGDDSDRLKIADMLSKGISLDKETIIKEILPKMESINISSSVQVAIMKLLENPPKEPRMTRLAPIMNDLFPEIKADVAKIYPESRDETEWTKQARTTLETRYGTNIDSQTRRDIIQGIMVYYFINELNNQTVLEDWVNNGGLS